MNSHSASLTEHSSSQKHHWRWAFPALVVASAIAVIASRLRLLPVDSLDHIALGLVVLLCALAGLGTFLLGVRWGVSHDDEQTEPNSQASSDSEECEHT